MQQCLYISGYLFVKALAHCLSEAGRVMGLADSIALREPSQIDGNISKNNGNITGSRFQHHDPPCFMRGKKTCQRRLNGYKSVFGCRIPEGGFGSSRSGVMMTSSMPVPTLGRIADTFSMSADYILFGKETESKQATSLAAVIPMMESLVPGQLPYVADVLKAVILK